ncbi:MAG: mannose-1-phosphate guanylyltransferase [Flavobacteriales bacterium]
MNNNYAVIMAGGIGSRFWPMSKTSYPKQFHDILGVGQTLLQLTFDRLKNICPSEQILIVTSTAYKDLVKQQLPEIKDEQILCEPSRRNTAPCVAYAAYKIKQLNPEANMVVAPSDHLILKEDAFINTLKSAISLTKEKNCLVTLGIKPNRPDTGYGYIQFVGFEGAQNPFVKKVKTFTEKPNHELAQQFIESGDFYWNSGIFIWSIASIIKAFESHLPDISRLFTEREEKLNTAEEEEFVKSIYAVCPNISIDYGIMEKSSDVYVVLSDLGWSDLGTWGSLYGHVKQDENENAVIGKNVMLYESHKNMVKVPENKLVVLQGLDDYIVVDSGDILLVCRKHDEQKIKQIVNDVALSKGEKFV